MEALPVEVPQTDSQVGIHPWETLNVLIEDSLDDALVSLRQRFGTQVCRQIYSPCCENFFVRV